MDISPTLVLGFVVPKGALEKHLRRFGKYFRICEEKNLHLSADMFYL